MENFQDRLKKRISKFCLSFSHIKLPIHFLLGRVSWELAARSWIFLIVKSFQDRLKKKEIKILPFHIELLAHFLPLISRRVPWQRWIDHGDLSRIPMYVTFERKRKIEIFPSLLDQEFLRASSSSFARTKSQRSSTPSSLTQRRAALTRNKLLLSPITYRVAMSVARWATRTYRDD